MSAKTITDLPLLTRNPYELVLLSPGATQPNNGNNGFSVNGSRDRNNNFLLDGVDNNDTSVPGGGTGILGANPDSTQEFRVITNNFNAEDGRNTGAIIDVITRGGSNQFHGDGYWFGRYNALGARDFFNSDPAPQDPYVRNDFGFSVGGPIIKDRTFFFINGEYQRFRTTLTESRTVPTAAFKSGVFTVPTATGTQTIDLTAGAAGQPDRARSRPRNPTVAESTLASNNEFLFLGVSADATNDAWAVGFNGSDNIRTSAMHWDGTNWKRMPTPNVGAGTNKLNGVLALAPNNVWAVGFSTPIASPEHAATLTLIEHFDGTSWAVVPSPNVGPNSANQSNRLFGLTANWANDIWAFGSYFTADGSGHQMTLLLHWDEPVGRPRPVPTRPRVDFPVICCGLELFRHQATCGLSGPGMTGLWPYIRRRRAQILV